ncbi:hypothetical protein DICVIV_10713 [Dictyocaulus viviparus]|uniref:Uncharacterized protein n=1 Tax=Dictyocaulus viviparus TaxID=29172 RepID=A0A0D8XLN0_DICVI|nr:hypothetical protein DICVIV_10713 [Dictyocaulus viviparus]
MQQTCTSCQRSAHGSPEDKSQGRKKITDDTPTYNMFAVLHFKTIVNDLVSVYKNAFMLKWSFWWALATCAYFQNRNYIQTLWGTVIDVNNVNIYNGFTEALCPIIGASELITLGVVDSELNRPV